MFDPSDFVVPEARPLPVALLLDTSWSMSFNNKIQDLNTAVKSLIDSFVTEEKLEIEIHVAVIVFGEQVLLHQPFESASRIQWRDLKPNGTTPMGMAMEMAKAMVEDKKIIPSGGYRPLIILVSDGAPTDDWKQPMVDLTSTGRSSKCDYMALAIGPDADKSVLEQFLEGSEHSLFNAQDADDLWKFFRYVTMSVTKRSQSTTPNTFPSPEEIKKSLDRESRTGAKPQFSSDGYY